jgi:WD40 repeat protein
MLLVAEAYGTFPMDITERVLRQVYTRSNAMFGLMPGHQHGVWHAAFSPDGKLMVTASGDKTARLCDVASGQALQVLSERQCQSDLGASRALGVVPHLHL